MPTQAGFWTVLSPFAGLQRWPFCYWVAVVVDHHPRRAAGFAVSCEAPSAADGTAILGRAIGNIGTAPHYTTTDKGKQSFCGAFKTWCDIHGIRPKHGAGGMHGSIAVVERFGWPLKKEGTRRIEVPMSQERCRVELILYFPWYDGHRPHQPLLASR